MKERVSEEEIQMYANRLMFRIKENEFDLVQKEFAVLNEMQEVYQQINTDGVKEMVYPFEDATSFLREDIVKDVLTSEEALRNAPAVKAGHIQLPKVVK